jgi:ketosteroid isomerase-like protein
MRSDARLLLGAVLTSLFAANARVAAQESAPPAGCTRAEHRQFDFWAGDWIVTNARGDTVGTNRIQPISDGCALLEQWLGSGGVSGTSINFFEPATGRWNQLWIGGRGLVLRLEGGFQDGAMELNGTRKRETAQGAVLDRLRWTPANDGSVEQLWLLSSDEGKTWRDFFRGIYRKRVETGDGATTSSSAVPAQAQNSGAGLTRLRERWIDAYQRGDSAAMAELYVTHAVRMPYDAASQQGHAQVLAAYGASFRARALLPTIGLVADELQVLGDVAAERGRYRERLRSRAGRK